MAQSVSATFKIGYSAGYSAAAQAGRGAISPSITQRQDYEYDWRNFMAGWNAGCRDWANGKDPRPFGGKSRKAAAAKRSNAIPADAIQKMRELWGLLQNLHSVSEIAKMSIPDLEKRLDPVYGLALDIGHNTNTEDQAFLGAHRVITSIFEQMWYTVRNQHKGGFMSPLGNEAARLVVRAAGESQRRIAHEAQRFKVKASKSRKDAGQRFYTKDPPMYTSMMKLAQTVRRAGVQPAKMTPQRWHNLWVACWSILETASWVKIKIGEAQYAESRLFDYIKSPPEPGEIRAELGKIADALETAAKKGYQQGLFTRYNESNPPGIEQ